MSTKYLLMQLEPERDYSFEISKNMNIQPGDYNCTLEVSGPEGTLALEKRRCSLEKPLQDFKPNPSSISPEELEAEFAKYRAREEMTREERVQVSEIGEDDTEEVVRAEKQITNEARDAAKRVAVAEDEDETMAPFEKKEKVEEENDSSLSGSLLASSSSGATKATFVGSSTSKKYHLPDCRYALKIKPENKIYFQSLEDAKRQGYLPCKSCNP